MCKSIEASTFIPVLALVWTYFFHRELPELPERKVDKGFHFRIYGGWGS